MKSFHAPIFRRLGIAWTAGMTISLVAPILVTALGAFSHADWYGQRSEGAQVASVASLFGYVWDVWGRALIISAKVVGVVTPLALLIGVPAAYAFRRYPFPGASFVESVALAALSVPGIALAVSLILFVGSVPRFPLLVAGHLVYTLPMVLKTVSNALATIDPEIESAARSLGASPWQAARRIVVPLLGPSIVLSALMVFTVSWGEFNVSYLLATPIVQTFPAALYATYTTNSFPVAAAATLIFLGPVIPILIAIQAMGGEEFSRGFQV